jgi:hypothetical protein
MNRKVRQFVAFVSYRVDGADREEQFPVQVHDFATAQRVALRYTLEVLRLTDFELRMVGA